MSYGPNEEPIEFEYTNHRGVWGMRRVTPKYVWYGRTKWHPEEQWFLRAWCHSRTENRDFPLSDFFIKRPVVQLADENAEAEMLRAKVADMENTIAALTEVFTHAKTLVIAVDHDLDDIGGDRPLRDVLRDLNPYLIEAGRALGAGPAW